MPVFNNALAGAAGSGGADAGYTIERSLRFNDADTAYLSDTPSSASSGNKKLTYSVWVKHADLSDKTPLYSASSSGGSESIELQSNGTLVVFFDEWTNGAYYTSAKFRDPSAWYHFVFVIDTSLIIPIDRVKIYVNGERQSTSISGTLNQEHTFSGLNQQNRVQYIGRTANTSGGTHHYASAYFAEIHMIDGQALAPTDFGEIDANTGVWNPIEYSGTYGTNGFHLDFSDNSSNTALGNDAAGSNNWAVTNLEAGTTYTTANSITSSGTLSGAGYILNGLIDYDATMSNSGTGAWIEFNPPGGIAYSSSVEVMAANDNADNMRLQLNGGSLVNTIYSNQYVTLATGSGTINKIRLQGDTSLFRWRSIRVDGVVLKEVSTGADSLIDTPTNYQASSGNNGGNYCTLNPLDRQSTHGVLSNGNLDLTQSSGNWAMYRGTMAVSSGKWYYEVNIGANQYSAFGILSTEYDMASATNNWPSQTGAGKTYALYPYNGQKYDGTQGINYATANTSPAGSVYGVAFDLDNGTITFYKDGSSLGQAFTGISGTFAPAAWLYNQTASDSYNFGQRPFQYPPGGTGGPSSDYKSLCTQNLDNPLISKGSDYFDIDTYTGTGNALERSEFSFEPDLLWFKRRSSTRQNIWIDSVRGVTKRLFSDSTESEATASNVLTSFDGDGFTLGTQADVNAQNETYVAWAWDGGDLVTNSAYNQDRTWSDGVTMSGTVLVPATSAFDGNPNTSACPYDTAGGGGANPWIQVTFNPGIPYTSSVKVERQNGNPTGYTVSMNGGTGVNSAFQAYTTVATGSGTLTSIRVTNNGSTNTAGISRIEVDGKVLVDKGVIPVGSLNSSLYNQSQTWSTGVSGSGSGGNHPSGRDGTAAFNGDISTSCGWTGTADPVLTATLPTAISATTLRVKGHFWKSSSTANEDVLISINGGTYVEPVASGLTTYAETTAAGGTLFIDCTSLITGGQVSSVSVKRRGSVPTSTGLSIHAIEVDGKILVDSNQTPANVPSIASTCRTSQTAGFSIVTATLPNYYTNYTIAHGLNGTPHLIIGKNRAAGNQWDVYHKDVGTGKLLRLNQTTEVQNATANQDSYYPTAPDSNVFGFVANNPTNNFVWYVFSPVNGFSSIGSYEANGGYTGPFVYTGFRPRWVMVKNADQPSNSYASWSIFDSERDIYNSDGPPSGPLYANHDEGEGHRGNASTESGHESIAIDFLSNGFLPRYNGTEVNGPANTTYIYLAFAENPFKISRAR